MLSPLCRAGHKWVNLHGGARATEKIPMRGNASKTQESCERAARGNIKNGEAKE